MCRPIVGVIEEVPSRITCARPLGHGPRPWSGYLVILRDTRIRVGAVGWRGSEGGYQGEEIRTRSIRCGTGPLSEHRVKAWRDSSVEELQVIKSHHHTQYLHDVEPLLETRAIEDQGKRGNEAGIVDRIL